MPETRQRRVAVLGASGGVGRHIVPCALARGWRVSGQTRHAGKLDHVADRVAVHAFDPRDGEALAGFVRGADAVVFALGVETGGKTTLFSDVTRALLDAMRSAGVPRLVVITGVGAGETRGHGGFVYDWLVFPLITRRRYADKDRQEALIAESDRDWIIVRPAPFAERVPDEPLRVHTRIERDTVLRRITRAEVAAFVVDQLDSDAYLRQRPFIGHP